MTDLSDINADANEGRPESSHRESDEGYSKVVFRRGKYRIIVCKDNIQWILQVRGSNSMAGARWRALSYHCERESLIRSSRAYFGSPTPQELIELAELFNRGRE